MAKIRNILYQNGIPRDIFQVAESLIVVLSVVFGGFGDGEFVYAEVYVCFMGLGLLVLSHDSVFFSVFEQPCSGLMKSERYVRLHTLSSQGEYPIVIAHSGFRPAFSAGGDFLYAFVKIGCKVDMFEKRGGNYAFVLYWQGIENRQAVICHLLVLHCATDKHVLVSVFPIIGKTLHEAVDAFCEKIEPKVFSPAYHLPTFISPRVCVFQKEIGGEACEDDFAAFYLP